ncbi:hypothetical protein EYR41_004638 [Orbilia oligospora]|uniref:Uncharacterized protein n=1 Tax=Orbilia oligospora TaxID=2813651 RepID=A0A8H2HY02_ORBOL|nr:hypothetical protein EYR41_004638 [Orbilia oligospora]
MPKTLNLVPSAGSSLILILKSIAPLLATDRKLKKKSKKGARIGLLFQNPLARAPARDIYPHQAAPLHPRQKPRDAALITVENLGLAKCTSAKESSQIKGSTSDI